MVPTMTIRTAFRASALCVAIFGTAASAQNINNILGVFGNLMQQAILERIRIEWTKVPQPELNCIDQTLRDQGEFDNAFDSTRVGSR